MDPSDRTVLKRSRSAGTREGHFLKTWYGIWSNGEGADEARDHLMAPKSSTLVTGLTVGIACFGIAGDGIHGGVE